MAAPAAPEERDVGGDDGLTIDIVGGQVYKRGALVELPEPFSWGNPYRAIGVMKFLQGELCPLEWNGVLEVEAVDG